jgi:hypothetical protein
LTRWRIHQTTSAVVVVPGVITRLEKAVWMISQASSFMRRKVASSSGSRDAMRSTASPSAGRMRRVHSGPSASCIPSRSPAESPSAKAKVRETLIAIDFGWRSSSAALSTCHCSSPQSSAVRTVVPLPAAGAPTGFVARTAS